MTVIGFDPGSIRFGVGLVGVEKGNIDYLYSEEIRLNEKDFYEKMAQLWKQLQAIYARFSIDEAAIEEGFLGKNVRSMSMIATVRGVVLGSLIMKGIGLKTYSPRAVKLAVTGNGSALKPQVMRMVKTLLDLRQRDLGSDESDALAVAYCHALFLK
jgi:crossover junction endodeoxyribonuclease RuvC